MVRLSETGCAMAFVTPKAATAAELKAELEAERAGAPFLIHRDAGAIHRIVALGRGGQSFWIGRRPSADLCLAWDDEVSRMHAQLEPVGGEWTLVDDGLSRNGSFVNGERVAGGGGWSTATRSASAPPC